MVADPASPPSDGEFRFSAAAHLFHVNISAPKVSSMTALVEKGRLEFITWEEATTRPGKVLTATKWVVGVKKNEGHWLVRCRLVARDFKPRHECPRDDLFAATPPLEATKALIAFVAGTGSLQGELNEKKHFGVAAQQHSNKWSAKQGGWGWSLFVWWSTPILCAFWVSAHSIISGCSSCTLGDVALC